MQSVFQKAAIAALILLALSVAIFARINITLAQSIPSPTTISSQKSAAPHLEQPRVKNQNIVLLPYIVRNVKPIEPPTPTPFPSSSHSVNAQLETISQPGPGLGNFAYPSGDLFSPISVIESVPEDGGRSLGHGSVAMVNGYLMVIYSSDGGGRATNGGIEFWDVSDPHNPKLYRQHENHDTHGLREPHGFGFSSSYRNQHGGTRDLLVAQAVEGIQIWDLTTPNKIHLVSYLNLPGITRSDYSGNWWTFWQAPYIYVAGTDHGLYIVDASDPANPQLVNQLSGHQMGGISPAQTFAVGNLLVVMANRSRSYATFDIGNPTAPALLHRVDGRAGYSHLFAAGKILTSGGKIDPNQMFVHDVSHAGHISYVGASGRGLKLGGYGSYQDGFFHSGFSNKYAKFDIENLQQINTGTSDIDDRDEDFAVALGNLVWVGNDHGQGSALIVHQREPDRLGPQVDWVHPADGTEGLPTTTRIGLSMSDIVNIESVNQRTFQVRPVGGIALAGKYSSQMGLVNFSPDIPLQDGVTYEVVVNGIWDSVGNPGDTFTSSFTIGRKIIATPVIEEPAEPEVVYDPLRCRFTTTPTTVDNATTYVADSNQGDVIYAWDWGDGGPTTVLSSSRATHVFTDAGRFPIILTATRIETEESLNCTDLQIVHYPATENAPTHSSSILYANGITYNVNSDNNTVSAIDGTTRSKIWETTVGSKPTTFSVTPDGISIWVVNQESAEISVLHTVDGTLKRTIPLAAGSQPYALVFSPTEDAAFVTLQSTGAVVKLALDGSTTASTQTGGTPRGVAITADGHHLLVTRFISQETHAEVKLLSSDRLELLHTFVLPMSVEPDSETNGRGLPNYLSQVVISPDGRWALVPAKKDNIERGLTRDGNELTFENSVRTIVAILDLENNQERVIDRLDLDNQALAQSVLFSPYGDIFFVANLGSNSVQFYELATGNLLGEVQTEAAPSGLVLNDDGSRLFVQNSLARTVSIFDAADLISGRANSMMLLDTVSVVENERLPELVLQGKRIFYNAADPRMSKDNYLSCASCHLDGGHDGRTWDLTQQGEGLRNTTTLRGFADMGPSTIHWTANFDEIQDFESGIRNDFSGTGFMTDTDFSTRENPLGKPKTGRSDELDALAAYVNSLAAVAQSPYRKATGELTADGIAGRVIFEREGCAICHAGQKFSDSPEKRLHDIGSIKSTSGHRLGEPLSGIDTPTLRGLWSTAPYLHDGSAPTLADAVLAHETVTFAETEPGLADLAQLVAYLKQIDEGEVIAPEANDLLFDFGPGAVATEHIAVLADDFYTEIKGYGFTTSSVMQQRDRGGVKPLTTDFVFSEMPWGFVVDLPNGIYKVTITTGEEDAAQSPVLIMIDGQLTIETRQLARGETGYLFETIEVADEQLSLIFVGQDGPVRMSSLHIRPAK